jgi:hypothetical protein
MPPDDDDERAQAKRELETDPGELGYTAVMSSFRNTQGCKVRVHRLTAEGKRQYCFMGPPEDFESEEVIRLFHAKQPYAREEGTYYLSVEVNGEPRNSFPVLIAPQINTPGIDQNSQASGGMADYVRELREQNRILMDRMTHSERTPMLEMVQGLSQLDALRGEKQLPLDSLLKAVEIGQRLNGGGPAAGGGDDWMGMLRDLVKEAAPTLVPAIGAIVSRMMTPAKPAQQEAPQQVEAGGDMTPEQRAQMEEHQMMLQLKGAMEYLKKKALSGSHPGLYVEMIVDNQDDPIYGRLIHKIINEDFSSFAAIDEDIAKPQYTGFFRSIYDGIRSVFIPKNTVAGNFSGKTGNSADTSGNGTTGKKRGQ